MRDRVVELVQKGIRACKGMGGVGILLPYFDAENLDMSSAHAELLIEDLKRCAPVAEDEGIKVALETSFSPGLLRTICDGVGSEMVGVYQDTANALQYGYDSVDMLVALPEHTKLIHLKDTRRSDLGEGDVDFPRVEMRLHRLVTRDGWFLKRRGGLILWHRVRRIWRLRKRCLDRLAEGEGIEPYAVARTTDQCQAAHHGPFTPYLSILTKLCAQRFLQG